MDTPMSKEMTDQIRNIDATQVDGTNNIGKPEYFASTAVFLLSEKSILLNGQSFIINNESEKTKIDNVQIIRAD